MKKFIKTIICDSVEVKNYNFSHYVVYYWTDGCNVSKIYQSKKLDEEKLEDSIVYYTDEYIFVTKENDYWLK